MEGGKCSLQRRRICAASQVRAEGVLVVVAGVVVAVVLLLVVVVVGAVVCVVGGGMAGRFRWCNGIGGLSVGWARGTDDREADMHEASSRLQRVSRRARSSSSSWFSPSCCYCYVVAVAVLLLQWNALRGEALHPPPAPPTRFFSRPSPPPPPAPRPPPHVCSLVTSLSSSSSSFASFSCSSSCFLAVALMLLLSLQWKAFRGEKLRPPPAPHPPLWRCHSTEAKQAAMTGQLMAIVLRTHGQRAAEQRPRIAAARDVCDTVSHP